MSGEKPREIAVEVLGRRSHGNDFTETLLEQALTQAPLSSVDRALCQELVFGVVRWQATLDWLVSRKTGNRAQNPVLQNLLRLGLYQIFWLERIPDHAAVHVTVELAKRGGFDRQAGFVNALLRSYLREADATRDLLAELKKTNPAVGYSHPEWLVARWQEQWGKDATAQLLAWNNTPPRTFARVNTLKIQPANLLPIWRDENVDYDFVRRDWLPENLLFELKSHPPLERLPSFQKGYFYVQDPSTLLAVQMLAPQPGERVLDLCAAPGGKLTYVAQLMQNEGQIEARDISQDRIGLIEENCKRLGVGTVETRTAERRRDKDGSATIAEMPSDEKAIFDRVLLDAPCSNTGVMRRRIDLRWRISEKEIYRLRNAQLELLDQGWMSLKTGGILVYSTCSLEPEENREVIDQFLLAHTDAKLLEDRELLPFTANVDGAYIASLKRH